MKFAEIIDIAQLDQVDAYEAPTYEVHLLTDGEYFFIYKRYVGASRHRGAYFAAVDCVYKDRSIPAIEAAHPPSKVDSLSHPTLWNLIEKWNTLFGDDDRAYDLVRYAKALGIPTYEAAKRVLKQYNAMEPRDGV